MGISASVVAHSVSPEGKYLLTMVWRYPRFIHGEVMTHRMLSRNAASSRAIPVRKLLEQVRTDPALPIHWGRNQPGMQARMQLAPETYAKALREWLDARDRAADSAEKLIDMGLHKQVANRILEPWMWMTCIVSATEWGNFYGLRRHPDAQPEMKALADAAYAAHMASEPTALREGEWHLPFVKPEEARSMSRHTALACSAARCARVSYLNHDGTEPNIAKDLALHDQLAQAPHASPFEHQGTPRPGRYGNFIGWQQYRQLLPNECISTYPGV
jgi:thymidylate synthase ThyX